MIYLGVSGTILGYLPFVVLKIATPVSPSLVLP